MLSYMDVEKYSSLEVFCVIMRSVADVLRLLLIFGQEVKWKLYF